MARLLIIQDPDSLRLLLRPDCDIPIHQVALVVIDNRACGYGPEEKGESQASHLSQPLDCAMYHHVSRRDLTEWVPTRVVITDDGRRSLRDDVACFNVCVSRKSAPEDLKDASSSIVDRKEPLLRAGDVELDPASHRVYRRGREIHLGPTEFRLLHVLLQNLSHVLTREQLLGAVWGSENNIDERTVDVHVVRLRKALNQRRDRDPIRTVRGVGYAFDAGAHARNF